LNTLPNPEKLEVLQIFDNNIKPTTLDFLRPFINLKDCKLGLNSANEDYLGKIEENFYNRFYGSLEPIKNLTKLEEFCIAGTDLEEGIEYIPGLIAKFSHEKSEKLRSGNDTLKNQNKVLANFFQNLVEKKVGKTESKQVLRSKKNENET